MRQYAKTDRSVFATRRRASRLNYCRTLTARPQSGTALGSSRGLGLDGGKPADLVRWSLGIHQGE